MKFGISEISNDDISGMGYLIHFHELENREQLWRNVRENNALPIVSSERTTSPTGLFYLLFHCLRTLSGLCGRLRGDESR